MGHFMDECKRIMIAVINMCGLLMGGWRRTLEPNVFFPEPTLIKAVTRVSTTQGYLIFIGGAWLNCCSSCMFFVFVFLNWNQLQLMCWGSCPWNIGKGALSECVWNNEADCSSLVLPYPYPTVTHIHTTCYSFNADLCIWMCVYMMALMAIDKSNVYLLSVLFMLNSSGQKKDGKIWSNTAVKDGIIAVWLDCTKTFMIFFFLLFFSWYHLFYVAFMWVAKQKSAINISAFLSHVSFSQSTSHICLSLPLKQWLF